jgi:hypothetical protein
MVVLVTVVACGEIVVAFLIVARLDAVRCPADFTGCCACPFKWGQVPPGKVLAVAWSDTARPVSCELVVLKGPRLDIRWRPFDIELYL